MIERYCSPCGEFYNEGDLQASLDFDPLEAATADSRACPFCWEVGREVDELAEQQEMGRYASICDGTLPSQEEIYQRSWQEHADLHSRC